MPVNHTLKLSPRIATNITICEEKMKTAIKSQETIPSTTPLNQAMSAIQDAVKKSWARIAPFWPLKNLIAVNPLQGLEHLSIEEAMREGAAYFQQTTLPDPMEAINRETIKWLQAFFDDGQATLPMPLRNSGLYSAWRQLAQYDARLHRYDKQKQAWIAGLPATPEQAIAECLLYLNIKREDRVQFLTLLLTTLSGWAAHVKYRTEWTSGQGMHAHPVSQADYLALRLAVTCLLWPEAKTLMEWHRQAQLKASKEPSPIMAMMEAETAYRLPLLKQLAGQSLPNIHTPDAQLIFCIDVRSEPFRRALEASGNYETFGFAGFFGIPVQIEDTVTGETYASCPVLLQPKHTVQELPQCAHDSCVNDHAGHKVLTGFKRFYQSLKYTFTTPFALVETLGIASGIWMGLRSFAPAFACLLKNNIAALIRPPVPMMPSLDSIAFADQCAYAEAVLKMMGLTRHFAPLVVLCGHGSTTQNNAYATALDCGACGGRHGASNARILVSILNDTKVREVLAQKHIMIPSNTRFIAALHNTTTDEVTLYTEEKLEGLDQLKMDLESARTSNSEWRCHKMGSKSSGSASAIHTARRSHDWAQVRPEWGLARNASFIVAPRDLTKNLNLEGRSFLHSYDYKQDPEGTSLTVILTAPMVVGQWINMQYLFSTLDNVAYGSGSKITKNITGKLGIMQGNASDLMTGLPLQSVYVSDTQAYHEMQRLMTVVYAPRSMIDRIIEAQDVLQKLFGNGWVALACIEPENQQTYFLQRDLTWQKVH